MSVSRRRGTRFESDIVTYLRDHGHPHAERRALAGGNDRGDIHGVAGWTLEAKATREIDLAGAVDEARKEAGNAGSRWFAAIVKRRNRSVSESYVVLPLSVFTELIGDEGDNQ